jgi:hypothetical protein
MKLVEVAGKEKLIVRRDVNKRIGDDARKRLQQAY